jgi:hypothetical protein
VAVQIAKRPRRQWRVAIIFEEFGSASVRKGSVQFILEILLLVESSAASRNQRLSQQTDCEPRLARLRISDENEYNVTSEVECIDKPDTLS